MTSKEPEVKRGRPKKRDLAVVEVADAMGIRLAADALSIEDLEGFPDIKGESKRNQAIMCMTACGFPQTHIADAFGVSQPTIWEIINRIDPQGMFKLNPNRKKAFITKIAEGVAMSALNSISYGDLLELDADKRASVAQKMVKVSQDLNVTKHKNIGENRMDLLLEQMAAESEDGEFVKNSAEFVEVKEVKDA